MEVSQRSWDSCYRSNLLGFHCVDSEKQRGSHEGKELVRYRSISYPWSSHRHDVLGVSHNKKMFIKQSVILQISECWWSTLSVLMRNLRINCLSNIMTLISITSTCNGKFFPGTRDLLVFFKTLILALGHFFYCWYVWVEGSKNNTESPQLNELRREFLRCLHSPDHVAQSY